MRARPRLRPDPARVLLVAPGDVSGARRAVWERVLSGCSAPVELDLATDLSRVAPGRYGAVVVEALQAADRAESVGSLRRAADAGCSIVLVLAGGVTQAACPALWELAGAHPESSEPSAEWFLKTASSTNTLTRRFPAEFPLTGPLVPLELSADTVALLQVSIGFHDRAVAAERAVGAGRVMVTGAVGDISGPSWSDMAQLLRRALAPREADVLTGPFGLGILGYGPFGGMGLHHGLAAAATEGIELLAVCDADPRRLKSAEEAFPGVRTSMSVDELIADDDVELVVVATPPVTHHSLALALLRAGRHVVLEKPMCLTVGEADELIGAADAAGLALTVHQSRRFDADFVTVRQLVDGGALGEVFNVETFVGGFEHPCRAWHSEVSISGGAVYDWGSHHLDWILQLMDGFPATLSAHGHKRVWHDVTNLDQVRVRLAWEDGREAEFLQSDVAGIRRPKFLVQGTSGTLAGWYRPLVLEQLEPGIGYVGDHPHHAEAPVEVIVARYEPAIGLAETRLPPARVPRYAFHRNLADHLQFGEPLAVTPASARRVVALLEAAQRSTDSGSTPVTLPRL